jgi:mono/diheme cytochrome c family protein
MRLRDLLATVAIGATCAISTAALAQAKADIGKRDYESKCATCHGLDGKGKGPYAEQLKHPLPDLTTLAKRNGGVFPASQTYGSIEGAGKGHGTRDMPVWGLDYTVQATEVLPDMPVNQAQFVRTRITALVEYLKKLQAK